jgi:hypothetical protein
MSGIFPLARSEKVFLACALMAGVAIAVLLMRTGFFPRTPDAPEAKRADSPVAGVEPSFDPKDVERTRKWLAEITKPYIQAVREFNVYRAREAEAAIRPTLEEIPTGTTISWTATVLYVDPTEVEVRDDWVSDEPKAHFSMALSPDDNPNPHQHGIKIGECITLETARSLKGGDLLVVTGTLSGLKVTFFNDDNPEKAFAAYDAVITNASVVPAK